MSGGRGTAHGLSTPTREHWLASAACRDQDPELFFPIGTIGPALIQAAQAKSVCRRCPVVDECLQWALEVGIGYGVAGGKTAAERQAMGGAKPASLHQGQNRPPAPVGWAAREHCVRGHEFSSANTRIRKGGGRQCLACERIRSEDRRLRVGAA